MKNYYEILEVSEKASSEVIEKAYKALVKKYHPDLQPESSKKQAEEKIKLINEAYDVLSNNDKKVKYDEELNKKNLVHEQKINNEKQTIKKPHQQMQPKPKNNSNFQNEYNQTINDAYNNAYNEAYNRAYQQAYINNLKNMGYEIKYQKTFKEHLITIAAVFFTIIILIIIGLILWTIPFTRNYLINLYNTNEAFKLLVNIIKNIFSI